MSRMYLRMGESDHMMQKRNVSNNRNGVFGQEREADDLKSRRCGGELNYTNDESESVINVA